MPIASFPMYDFPKVRDALNTIWTGFVRHLAREGLSDVPRHLLHDRALHDLWTDPNLYVCQCCGYDLTNRTASRKTFEDDDVRAAGERLFIDSVECLPLSAYAVISEIEERAVREGYPELC